MLLINRRLHVYIQDVRVTLKFVAKKMIVRCEETSALENRKSNKRSQPEYEEEAQRVGDEKETQRQRYEERQKKGLTV